MQRNACATNNRLLKIGSLSLQTGVNIATSRYYEREGLPPELPRTAGGYRAYGVRIGVGD